ncbi:MAG: hypothetical protein HUJ73_02960, partial [Eubacterium sp.]|nr:hypothetical protein [Eubacterium sp.]
LYNLTHSDTVYVINGLIADDKKEGYIIDCNAIFNSAHCSDATAVTLSDIVLADKDGNILYNYVFDKTYTVILSGYIERCPLELTWENTEFTFDGGSHCPSAEISDDIPAVDDGHLSVTVSGAQTYVGEWNAIARLNSDSEATRADDYSISNGSKTYKIKKKEISFAMVSDTVTYDGEKHTLAESEITDGELVEGHSYVLSADSSYVHKGNYNITPENVIITDEDGAIMTENYEITCESSGVLTINAREVTVSGIKAEDKTYDGTTDASLTLSDVVFAGIVDGDSLSLDGDKLSGEFDTKDVGEGKTVSVSYEEGALTGSSASDYILNTGESQKTCEASILKKEITVKAKDAEVVYGETPSFEVAFTGFAEGETKDVISGDVSYLTGNSRSTAKEYDGKEHVGTYTIYPVVTGLSADNYSFAAENGTLTVTVRPITAAAAEGALLSKTYDGTTDVKTTLARGTHYEFAGVAGEAASGIVNGDIVNLVYTAAYDDIHPLERIVTAGELSVDNDDYEIVTASFDIPGEITRKTVTVKADKKTISYGSSAPVYTVKYTGFENGEDQSVLSGTLAFACDYDTSVPEQRIVGNYTITPSGLSSDDYLVEFKENDLVVQPAEITLNTLADTYTLIYGTKPIPTFSYAASGFKYDDDASVINIRDNTVNYVHELTETTVTDEEGTRNVVNSVPDIYTVTLEETRDGNPVFTADNYSFKVIPAEVEITRAELTIGDLRINSRVYDGTKKVYANQLDYSWLVTAGLLAVDRGVFNETGAANMFTVENPTYNSKNVAEASSAEFTITYGEYLAARYTPKNDQTSAEAYITKRPLVITADRTEVWYGDAAPEYTVTYEEAEADSGSGLVSGETADSTNVTISCDYESGWSVNTYEDVIVPSGFTGSSTALLANYDPSYVEGDLEVKQRRLESPEPVWKENSPGVIVWDEVPGVCNVEVAGYDVVLMKDGDPAEGSGASCYVESGSTLEVDFLSLMRENGAGAYTVEVTAIASEVNNPNKENLQDSLPGRSETRYAAKMIFEFADDEVTQSGKTDEITIHGEESYVVIAGESGIGINAVLKNATGYTINTVNAANTVTVANPSDTARDGVNFATTVSLSENHASAADVRIALVLSARPATLTAVVKPAANGEGTVTNETIYGYSTATAPVFKVACSHNDQVAPPEYTYTYAWELRTSRTVQKFGAGTDTWTLPLNKKANTNVSYYLVRCVVTATRSDNGQSVTVDQPFNEYASKYEEDNTLYNVIVNKAAFRASVTMEGWTYGEVPVNTELHYDESVSDNTSISLAKYYYAPKDETPKNNTPEGNALKAYALGDEEEETWTLTKPSDAGTYKVRAYVPASENYNEFTTESYEFTIEQAKLDPPENIEMSPSETADYGLLSWDAVDAPKRDGTGEAVGVKYLVKLYRDGEDTPFKVYDPVSDLFLDITADIQIGAKYNIEITAVSQDPRNCLDSDPAFAEDISVGANIRVSGNGTLEGDTFTQKYDGTDITLTVDAAGSVSSYQWYKDGGLLSGAGGDEFTLRHVTESGRYTCVVTIEGEKVHTPILNVVVTKRSLTLTSGTDSKTYDGTPLTKHTMAVTGDGFVSGEGMDYSYTGSATNVSDTKDNNNTFTYSYKTGTRASDYETPVKVCGTLTILPKEINKTGFTYSDIPDYVYDGTAHKPEPTVTDTELETELKKDTDFTFTYSNNVNAGENTASVTITGKGNYTGSVTLQFTIKKRPVKFTAVSEEKPYTGSEIEITDLTVSSGVNQGLVAGHKHNVEFSASGTEASAVPYTGTITAKSAVEITLADGTDVTENYDITVINGTLTINKTDEEFTVALPSDSYTYDAAPHYNKKTVSDTAKTGTTTYQYSFTKEGGYKSSLSELTKTNAGTYTIYIKATNPNYNKTAESSSSLIIEKKAITVAVAGKQVTKEYDGAEHTAEGYTLNANSTLYDVSSVSFTGNKKVTRKDAGTTSMGLAAAQFANTDGNFTVRFDVTDGFVKITKISGVTVSITGKSYTGPYNGETHSVSGYNWTPSNTLYKVTSFDFSGTAAASRKDAGTTYMGLAEDQFENTDGNFENVTFVVTDGFVKINPINGVVVTVRGKNHTDTYDGDPHDVSGYDWTPSNTLYKVNSFRFTGTAAATRTNAGTTYMGLKPDQFENTDANFTNVTFNVTDGFEKILPIDGVTVTIRGNSWSGTYDGGKHEASGYSWSADDDLYEETSFDFSGTAYAYRTDAGTSNMQLNKAQFRNTDSNFINVTFDVADGFVKIGKKAAKITVRDAVKTFGNPDPAFTGEITGLVPGESLTGVVYRRTNTAEDVGVYEKVLTADKGNNPNYEITVVNADFEIARAESLTVNGTDYTGIYDGESHGLPAGVNVARGT